MIFSLIILVLAFLSLIVLMIIHEFGHFIIAKKFGVRVDEFGIGYPPRLYGKKIGETIYSINWLPLGAFVRIYGEEGGVDDYRSFQNLKIWQRIMIIIGGVVAFWIAAIILFSIVFAIGTEIPIGDSEIKGLANPQVKIITVSQDSPASQAGLKISDTIKDVKVNGGLIKINKVSDFQKIVNENKGKEITVIINRNSQEMSFDLIPRVNHPETEGAIGIGLERLASLTSPWYLAPVNGAIYTWDTTKNALIGLYDVFANLLSKKGLPEGAAFAGPLGITVFLANAANYGLGFFLFFVGIISVFVAIFNLFPIPALDGGKLVFLLIEKIKGKPVSPKIEQNITVVFFFILIALSIFITIKFDIPRFAEFLTSSLSK